MGAPGPVRVEGIVGGQAVRQTHVLDGHGAAHADGAAVQLGVQIVGRLLGSVEIDGVEAVLFQAFTEFLDVGHMREILLCRSDVEGVTGNRACTPGSRLPAPRGRCRR